MSRDGELGHGVLVAPVRGHHERPQVHKRRPIPGPGPRPAYAFPLAVAGVDRPVRGGLLAVPLGVRAQEDEGVRSHPRDAGGREPREAPGRGGRGRGRRKVRGARERAAPAEREDFGEVRGIGCIRGGGGGAGVEEGAEGLRGGGGRDGGGGGRDAPQRVGREGVRAEVDGHGYWLSSCSLFPGRAGCLQTGMSMFLYAT